MKEHVQLILYYVYKYTMYNSACPGSPEIIMGMCRYVNFHYNITIIVIWDNGTKTTNIIKPQSVTSDVHHAQNLNYYYNKTY